MLAAQGCEPFETLREQAGLRLLAFVQAWSSREARDAAIGELTIASGHRENILATLDEGVLRTFCDVVP